MDFNIHHQNTMFLKKVICKTKKQEEVSETIVPDSYPDIDEIIDSYAQAILRSKDCRKESVTISGGIKGGILYRSTNDPHVYSLDFYIPFSYKIEDPNLTEQTQIITTLQICAVDGRIINSRKAMLRVELAYRIWGYERSELTIPDFTDKPDHLQVKTQSYSIQLPLETAERIVKAGDVLALPAAAPAAHVQKLLCDVVITDQNLSGNRGVFKGNVVCKLLYIGTDQELHVFSQQIPFSQCCEFLDYYEDHSLEFYPIITGYDLETDRSENMSKIPVNVNILMQAIIKGEKHLVFPEDAYSVHGIFNPVWSNTMLDVTLDRMRHTVSFTETFSGEIRDILDIDLYWDYPTSTKSGDQTVIQIPISVHILGKREDRMISSAGGLVSAVQTVRTSPEAECISMTEQQGSVFVTPSIKGLEFRMEAITDTVCTVMQKFKYVSSGTLDKISNEDYVPKVIMKRIGEPCSIWNLAKQYAAKETLIRHYNQIETDLVDQNSVILIPVG